MLRVIADLLYHLIGTIMTTLMRAVALAAAVATLPSVVSAQKNQFEKGSSVLNLGLHVGSGYIAGTGVGLSASFEQGIAPEIANIVRIGVGGQIGFLRSSVGTDLFSAYGIKTTEIPILVFVNGHYQIEQVPKLDVYAGPVLGVSRSSNTYDSRETYYRNLKGTSSTSVAIGVHAGARYSLAPKISGSAEVGVGSNLPWLNFGIALKR